MRMRVSGPSRGVRRRSWRDAEFASLDFETTGLDFSRDTIVSFGVIPVRGGRVVLADAVHQLVDPALPPSVVSQKIHELRPQDLAGAPRLEQARLVLRDAIRGRYLLVWYADVELHFLSAIFGTSVRSWRRRTIDVRNLAIEADGGPRSARADFGYGLTRAAARLGVPVANPHDALDDALVTAQAFLVLATRLPAVGPEPSVGDLARFAGVGPGRVEQRFKLGV
jgi:DNA polymerase-3 subunit epsilon